MLVEKALEAEMAGHRPSVARQITDEQRLVLIHDDLARWVGGGGRFRKLTGMVAGERGEF